MNLKQFIASGDYLIDEVKRRNHKAGQYFFTAETMRFFSSRVSELAWQKGDHKDYRTNEIYFITSEADKSYIKHSGSIRAFTIRKCDIDGDIDTISKFQEYGTLGQARKGIKEFFENSIQNKNLQKQEIEVQN